MFNVCLPYQHGLSVCHTNTNLDMLWIFSPTETPQRLDVWTCCGVIGVKGLSQRHSNALFCSETELKVNNLVVINLHSYPLSCTPASWNDTISVFHKGTTAICPLLSIDYSSQKRLLASNFSTK